MLTLGTVGSVLQEYSWLHPLWIALAIAMLLEKVGNRTEIHRFLYVEPESGRHDHPISKLAGRIVDFASLFDRVFTKRHLSWRCFLRSGAASALFLALVWLSGFLRTEYIMWKAGVAPAIEHVRDFQDCYRLFAYSLLIAWIPDYWSLFQTRVFISIVDRSKRWTTAVWVLGLDLIATTVICLLISLPLAVWLRNAEVINGMHAGPGFVDDYMASIPPDTQPKIRRELRHLLVRGEEYWWNPEQTTNIVLEHPFAPLSTGAVFYSGYMTTLWLWLYLLARGTRGALECYGRFCDRLTVRFLRASDHPLITLWIALVPLYLLAWVVVSAFL